jgi:hypothetical protein
VRTSLASGVPKDGEEPVKENRYEGLEDIDATARQWIAGKYGEEEILLF